MKRLALLLAAASLSGCSAYTSKAYFGRGSNSAIRGYPTIDPPANYTGIWTDYKFDGTKLAERAYWNGKSHGTSFWYRDDGSIYLIRHYEYGRFVKDYLIEPLPKEPSRIPFWYPARTRNQSVVFWNRQYIKKAQNPG